MTDFNTLYHIAGGIVSALLVIFIMDKRCYFGSTMGLSLLSGFIVNGLWELLADTFHWLPFHAVKPDVWDIVYGGAGGAIICVAYFIHKFQKGEL